MSDTWVPSVDDVIECVDNSYNTGKEKPYIGQYGRVKDVFVLDNHRVLVIEFRATKNNDVVDKDKATFREYFHVGRQCNLYFKLIKSGVFDPSKIE